MLYLRHEFPLGEAPEGASLLLKLRADDGAVVYLNGREVKRVGMPTGELAPTTLASRIARTKSEKRLVSYGLDRSFLRKGANVLAVSVHQQSPTSSDLAFDFELQLQPAVVAPVGALLDDLQPEALLEKMKGRTSYPINGLPQGWRKFAQAQLLAMDGQWSEALARTEPLVSITQAGSRFARTLARFRWHALDEMSQSQLAFRQLPQGAPRRPEQARPSQLDLTDHYTGFVDERFLLERDGLGLQARFPSKFGGQLEVEESGGNTKVKFDVRGMVALSGHIFESTTRAFTYPVSAPGMEVGMPVDALHFLHALMIESTTGPDWKARAEVASYRIRYVDGRIERISLYADHQAPNTAQSIARPRTGSLPQVRWCGGARRWKMNDSFSRPA